MSAPEGLRIPVPFNTWLPRIPIIPHAQDLHQPSLNWAFVRYRNCLFILHFPKQQILRFLKLFCYNWMVGGV